ncbi:MAG: UbiA family prenyltransferase [Planctomycetota bacterium]|nr:MAG: UbiA family prenyltransferase [Planctomycetota bacterium]
MSPYVQILRIDHWFKNVFIIPGIAFALLADPSVLDWPLVWSLSVAVVAVCLAASSNYVINEILDAPYDNLHPTKKDRAVPSGKVNLKVAWLLWITLGLISLVLGFTINHYLGISLLLLLIAGLLYNIPPLRTKDLPFLDVVSEAVNNPIRLVIGWYATGCTLSPPISLLMCYWALGSFLMAVKRLAEYRYLNNTQLAADYRSSFKYYNEARLLVCIMFYATACAMFAGIFIARYHLELVLCVPPFAVFMALYLRVGLKPNSPAQHPEQLMRSRSMILASFVLTAILCFSLWLDSPWLRRLFKPTINPQLPVNNWFDRHSNTHDLIAPEE